MPLVPSHIKKLKKYKPGRSIQSAEKEAGENNYIKLASNENPLGASPLAIKEIKKSLLDINRYPDATGHNLRKKLANKFNIQLDNVTIGSGSEGIMSTIMRTFLLSDDEIIGSLGSFIGFKVLANASGNKIHWVPMKDYRYDLSSMADKITDYTKIIYIANPDNPTGTYINKSEFDHFYSKVPKRVLIILDEAYYEFAKNKKNYPDSMIYRYDNVITLRTFSKAYGLSGLRLGYGFAHKDLISNLNKVKPPFEPSSLAQKAGVTALDDDDFLKNTLDLNQSGMEFLMAEFNILGVNYIPSCANFITTIWKDESEAEKITNNLLKKGVIVRRLSAFGWKNLIRISIGLEQENVQFIKSLKEIL